MTSIFSSQKLSRRERRFQNRRKKRLEKRFLRSQDVDKIETIANDEVFRYCVKQLGKVISWKDKYQQCRINIRYWIRVFQVELVQGRIPTLKSNFFYIDERGKIRLIESAAIPIKVFEKAESNFWLRPVLVPTLIYDSGSSIPNKGTAFSRKRVVQHLRKYFQRFGNQGYVLLIDFKDFFNSIPHDSLNLELFKYFKNTTVQQVIFSENDKMCKDGIGLSIGAEPSQINSVFYGCLIDHFIKDRLSVQFYGKHADDAYVLHPDKNYLRYLKKEIENFSASFGLKLHEKKTRIVKLQNGFTYLKCKYRLTKTGKIIRTGGTHIIRRLKKTIKKQYEKLQKGLTTKDKVVNEIFSVRQNLCKNYMCHKKIRQLDKFTDQYGLCKIKKTHVRKVRRKNALVNFLNM